MALNSFYTEATAATERHFAPKVVDNIFTSNPVAMMLKRDAKTLSGGESIELPSIYAKGTGEWFREWDNYGATYKEQIGAGRLNWKLYTVPVVLSHLQLLKNGDSKERRFDLAMQKNIIAAKTAADDLGTALFSTTDAEGDATIDSLDRAVSAGTTTYAGILRAPTGDTATWAANVDSTTTTLTMGAMQTMWGDCSEGDEHPTLIATTQLNFNRYWNTLTPIQRLGSETLGKAGFLTLLFNGVPVVVDSHIAANYMYFLNMNHVQLVAHKLAFFNFEKAMVPSNQWVHIGRYFFVGNVTCDAPRYQGKFTALTS